jgi:bacteriocin biosynthesis cyclodehydratase domain-containing protein
MTETLYTFRPLHLIPIDDGVILRRGAEKVKVSGEHAHAIVETLVAKTARGTPQTLDALLADFRDDLRPDVDDLLRELRERRFLTEAGEPAEREESPADVLFWQLDRDAGAVRDALATAHVAVVGINRVGLALADGLLGGGFAHVELLSHPLLDNVGVAPSATIPGGAARDDFVPWAERDPDVDCLVVTSDFGGLETMRDWNARALRGGFAFYPAVVQDGVAYLGPVVVAGSGACFECLWQRQNSHVEEPGDRARTEPFAFFGQYVDAALPAMGSAAGYLASIELTRYFGRLPGFTPGTHVEVDLLTMRSAARKVLRVPRCAACGVHRGRPTRSVDAAPNVPGNAQ